MSERSAFLRRWCFAFLAMAVVLVGVGRIVSTYPVFWHTFDEPAHIAMGMEWLDRGSYAYEPLHPPLARVAVALGPWLSGARSAGLPDFWDEGDAVLHGTRPYARTLALARLGILPFFLLAAGLVWSWGRRLFGDGAALAATVLFTTLPPVLAHAGLATTDMAITATLPLAVYAFGRWLEWPSLGRCVALGVAVGAAVLSKLSALVLLPSCVLMVVGWRWAVTARRSGRDRVSRKISAKLTGSWLPGLRAYALVACTALVVLWAGYRFSLVPAMTAAARPHVLIDRGVGPSGVLHDVAYAVAEAPILPLSELVGGIAQVIEHNTNGQLSYLLGRTSLTGWWWFFPVALLVKTPIPFLLLAALGCILSLKASWQQGTWETAVPALCAMAVLLTVLPSRINVGLRHVLPIYPFLAIAAGFGWSRLSGFGQPGIAGRAAAVLLLGWHLTSGLVVHPDYLAYFNEIAGRRPDRLLVDSDLDWGQDLHRLSDALRRHGVTEVAVSIHGHLVEHELMRHDLTAMRPFDPDGPPSGWVAVSAYPLRMNPRYSWLNACESVETIGRSIQLYRFPEEGAAPPLKADSGGSEGSTWSQCRR